MVSAKKNVCGNIFYSEIEKRIKDKQSQTGSCPSVQWRTLLRSEKVESWL